MTNQLPLSFFVRNLENTDNQKGNVFFVEEDVGGWAVDAIVISRSIQMKV